MANAIKRKITLGIAKESVFNVAEASPTFLIPAVDMTEKPNVNYTPNKAMLGSSHGNNSQRVTTKDQKMDFEMEVDEDVLALLLLQNFTDSVANAAGETAVKVHTLAYNSSNNGASYTLFIQDDDREDKIISGFRYADLALKIAPQDKIKVSLGGGRGKLSATGSVTNTISGIRDFVAANATYTLAKYGESLAAMSGQVLSIDLDHKTPLVADEQAFGVGSQDMQNNSTLETDFMNTVKALYPDNTYRDHYEAGDNMHSQINIVDTSRYVDGSVANTNPVVKIVYPHQNIVDWTPSGDPGSALYSQELKFSANDEPSVSGAPLYFEITNRVASY